MKIHHILPLVQKAKNQSAKDTIEIYKQVQKSTLFEGLTRTYQPVKEGEYVYPAEVKPVTCNAEDMLDQFKQSLVELYNLTFTQDKANQKAVADIIIDNVTILKDVPITHLLFLESKIADLKTFISALPILDSTEEWKRDLEEMCYKTEPKQTAKTKKISKPIVLYEATEQHPAQVKEASEDVVEGTWSLVRKSTAVSLQRQKSLLDKVIKLEKAVILARETANQLDVDKVEAENAILNYVFSSK